MTRSETPGGPFRPGERSTPLDRRRFLAHLGALAGGAALLPLIGSASRVRAGGVARERADGMERVEAGRPALGTWMRVVVRHSDRATAERAIAAAFAAVRRVDAQMSVHRADSQLARVNAAAGHGAVAVDDDVRAVVAMACEASRRSGGVYDPTVLPLMRLYGFYGGPRREPPGANEVDQTLQRMGCERVQLAPRAGTLALDREGAGIDLGSIGKGWAVDRAVDALRAAGVRSALVDLGGNVYGLGTPDDGAAGWSVGVTHPITGQIDHVFVLRDAAVATSGNSEQTRTLGPLRIGHLFDARRGLPASGHLAASAQAATGVESDVQSTVAFLIGPDRFRGWPGNLQNHFIG